jgi:hypothetical protein
MKWAFGRPLTYILPKDNLVSYAGNGRRLIACHFQDFGKRTDKIILGSISRNDGMVPFDCT